MISGNTVQGSTADGGGISLSHSVRVIGNVITNNEAVSTNSSNAGGIFVSGAAAVALFSNNIIAENRSSVEAGGFTVTTGAQVTFVNNTIVYNSSKGAEGGRVSQATVRMMNNICWNPGNGAELAGIGPSRASNNLIRSSYYGENFNIDPGFSETTSYSLSPNSPCISAGKESLIVEGGNWSHQSPTSMATFGLVRRSGNPILGLLSQPQRHPLHSRKSPNTRITPSSLREPRDTILFSDPKTTAQQNSFLSCWRSPVVEEPMSSESA